MKRAAAILAALWLLCAAAHAELMLDGTVTCMPGVAQEASMGGTVSEVYVQAGDYVHAGDAVARLTPTRVYAPCDGTVEALFAAPGQSADTATSRYGGVMALLPESLYTVYASSEYAYESVRTSQVVPGQPVYMKCTRDGSHRGVGVVTETDGNLIWIDATGGTFHNGETVYVYMESDYQSRDRLAKGTVVASTVRNVSATGYIYKTYVAPGDFVEKGQLLMETLTALPQDGTTGDCVLTAEAEGYVASVSVQPGTTVQRGAAMLTYCPADGLRVTAQASEFDVNSIALGDPALITAELSEETVSFVGTVSAISYLPGTGGDGETTYDVTIALSREASLAPGMTVTVTL